jgi:hypothetical protein
MFQSDMSTDDRCSNCIEFDKDGCPNCGPKAIRNLSEGKAGLPNTTYKGIPIEVAKKIAEEFDKDQVIIVTWDRAHGRTHVVTYGKTLEECNQAASGGNLVKRALGWPDDLCQAKPDRS